MLEQHLACACFSEQRRYGTTRQINHDCQVLNHPDRRPVAAQKLGEQLVSAVKQSQSLTIGRGRCFRRGVFVGVLAGFLPESTEPDHDATETALRIDPRLTEPQKRSLLAGVPQLYRTVRDSGRCGGYLTGAVKRRSCCHALKHELPTHAGPMDTTFTCGRGLRDRILFSN